ncbi:MAG: hypothetical protein P4L50_24410 [Anaerolineaceae bacterium]|nr:hypothetical protein [Anaerolineaceae bacterium]
MGILACGSEACPFIQLTGRWENIKGRKRGGLRLVVPDDGFNERTHPTRSTLVVLDDGFN